MSKQMLRMLIIVSIVFALIFGWYGAKKIMFGWFMSHYEPPPVTVSASTASTKIWQSYLTSVGTLTAVNGVDISSEAPGIVKEILFKSGQSVQQGDTLVLLDTSVEAAQLKDNKARLKLAQLNYDRNKSLSLKKTVSQSTMDNLLAQLQEAQAGVETIEAKIKQKTITAPFSGKIGICQINVGEYVSAGTTMVSLQALDPLRVKFSLPEQYVSELYVQQPIDININLSGGTAVAGEINAINSKVDQTTRNILVQATIPNKDSRLYPGMFAAVKIWLREQKNIVVLPQTAISYSLHGDSVFIIKEEGKDKKGNPLLHAYRQYVKIGERRDNEVSILEGVKEGDQIVTSGQLKLQNGTHIIIDNSVEL